MNTANISEHPEKQTDIQEVWLRRRFMKVALNNIKM